MFNVLFLKRKEFFMYRLGGTDILRHMLSKEIRNTEEYADYMNEEITYEQWKKEQHTLTQDLLVWSLAHTINKDLDEQIVEELNNNPHIVPIDILFPEHIKAEWQRQYEEDEKAYKKIMKLSRK